MKRVAVEEAGAPVAEMLESVERGEEVVITRAGSPVARIVRAETPFDPEKARKAIEAVREFREHLVRKGVQPFTIEEILSLRDEGRKY